MIHKKILAALLIAMAGYAGAQDVISSSYSSLKLQHNCPKPQIETTDLLGNKFQHLTIEGYRLDGHIGGPAVPTRSTLIEIPDCDDIIIHITDTTFDTINLDEQLTYLPQQPGRSKSDTSTQHLFIDQGIYRENYFHGKPLATVEEIGVARDKRFAVLDLQPIRVNPVEKKAIVCLTANIAIEFVNPDSNTTEDRHNRYYTPAFSIGKTLSKLPHSNKAKTAISGSPERMLIFAPQNLRCQRLNNFVEWKHRQGIDAEIVYTDENGLTTANAIANYLKDLYTQADANNPAPTYILLVGDVEQLPAFSSKISSNYYYGIENNHITDLYYTTWTTGDILPDCYQGRFSATDTITLGRIINKTILYESYAFADDSYLARAALVSGVDQARSNDNAYRCADPTMDYAAKLYINANNGYEEVTYLKNNTNYAPTGVSVSGSSNATEAANNLVTLYNTGLGWINYSAHGEWDRWEDPRFNTGNAAAMTNYGKPSVMIGNCCLSSKFNRDECLAEALLRRGDNAGAVIYIGGTNSTYWDEDFYWAVGVRNQISNTMVPAYDANYPGVYDGLFHTHNEAFEKQATTAGSMVVQGCMSVNKTKGSNWGSIVTPYYWEIYELMGDPSLMPWIGQAKTLSVNIDTTSRPVLITTTPFAYAALIDTATLQIYCAGYTNAEGVARLNLPDEISVSRTFLSVSAHGYKPFLEGPDQLKLGLSINVNVFPNPSNGRTVTVDGTQLKQVNIYDEQGRQLESQTPTSDSHTMQLDGYKSGIYVLEIITSDGPTSRPLILN